MASDTAILRFLCNICGTMVKKENVNQHLKAQHGNIGNKCERCGFAESDSNRMMVHLKIHLQERFECPLCGDIYATPEAYLVHYLSHEKSLFQQKIFHECSECGESFYPTSDIQQRLQQHVAQHTQTEEQQAQIWDPSSLLSASVKEEMYDEEQVDEKPSVTVSEVIQGLNEEYAESTDSYISAGDIDAIGPSEPEVPSVLLADAKFFENVEPEKDKDNDQSEAVKEDCGPELNGVKTGAIQTPSGKSNVKSHRPKRQCAQNVQYDVLSGQAAAEDEGDMSDLENRIESDGVSDSPTPTKVSETRVRSHRPKRQSSENVVNKELSCEVCKKTFKSKLGFEYHKNTQHLDNRKILPCQICEKTFVTKNGLQMHQKNQHLDKLDFLPTEKDDEAEDTDEGKLRLKSHRRKRKSSEKVEEEALSCEVCKKTFKSKLGFEYHKNTQHVEKRELLPCEFCEKTFRTLSGLQNHQENKHPEKVDRFFPEEDNDTEQNNDTEEDNDEEQDKTKSFSCKVCEKVFDTKRMLRYHQKTDHRPSGASKTKLISCSICKKILKSKQTLYYHERRHQNNGNHPRKRDRNKNAKKISCDICNKVFKSWFLEYHKKTHHSDQNRDTKKDIDPKVITCDICTEIFETSLSLKLHLKEVHQKEIHEGSITSDEEEYVPRKRPWRGEGGECVVCKKYFKNRNSLRIHQRLQHENTDTLSCRFCKKRFKTGSGRDIHEKSQHFEENLASGVVPCDICEKLFTSVERLRDHQKLFHLEEGMELCSVCGETFKTKSQYRYHMKQHKANFECKACHKTFHTNKKLRGHMNIAGCHMCEVCGLKFKQRYNLVTHRSVHTGEKPFQCYECGKCFRVKYYLEEHLKVHKGVRNYPCGQCDWKFKTMGQLRRHSRSHTGFKPNMCSQCGKAFAFPANLKRHERIHTGETYSCPLCDRKITEKSNLQKHLKIHEKRGEKILGPAVIIDTLPWELDEGSKEAAADEKSITDLWQVQISEANATRGNPVLDMDQDTGQLQMHVPGANATEVNADQDTSSILGLI